MKIGIIGDYNSTYRPHIATKQSLEHVGSIRQIEIIIDWVPTSDINTDIEDKLLHYSAIWLAPAPYSNKPGVLKAIKYIRENNIPFLGTCGGLMYSLIEFGKNVLGMEDDKFEIETENTDNKMFLMDSHCGVNGFKRINFRTAPGTKTSVYYEDVECEEESNCGFEVNSSYYPDFANNGLVIGGMDENNEAKIFEHATNKYFILTKFLPQLRSWDKMPHPLVKAFVDAGYNKSRTNCL